MFNYKQIEEIQNEVVNDKTFSERYEMGKNLYYGDSYKVFQTNENEEKLDERIDYLSFNVFAQIVDTYTNLAFYEKPKITFKNPENQKWFDTFANQEFFSKMVELFKISCYAGDSVCYLNIEEETGVPEVVVLPNTRWVPLYNKNRPDKEAKTHLVEFKHKEDDKEYKIYQFFTKVKEGEEYKCQTGFVAFEGENEVKIPSSFAENLKKFDFNFNEENKIYIKEVDHKLFFRFKNKSVAGEYFGRSDFTSSILSKAKTVNSQLDLINFVLKKVSDPILTLPSSLISNTINSLNNQETRDSTANALSMAEEEKSIFSSSNYSVDSRNYNYKGTTLQETIVAHKLVQQSKIIPNDKSDQKPEYISHEANTDKQEGFIKELLTLIYREAKLSPVLFDGDFRVANLSGTALQRLIQETLHQVHTKELNFEIVLKEIIYNILKMSGYSPEIPTIEWYDGIIDSKLEKIEEVERLLMNEFITKKEAVKQARGLTDEQAEKVLQEIEKENGYPSLMQRQEEDIQETEN